MSKKMKNETALLREALRIVMEDATRRGIVEFEARDSRDLKVEYAYRLLVHDKKIAPLPTNQLSMPNMKHRLAKWVAHELPPDHELLK
jgi:membrane-bound ClpP family serine protease